VFPYDAITVQRLTLDQPSIGVIVRGRTVFTVFIATTVVAIIAIYAMSTIGIFDHIPRNYNEGWNAYQVKALLQGQPLYPAWNKPWVNNYPPLSFYVVAALSLATHDIVVSGRLISLVGILATGFNIGAISAALTRNKLSGLVAALFFLIAVGVWFQRYVATNDPQWLGHGVQTTGALILLAWAQSRRPSLAPVVLGTALMFSGCIVKHNLVVLPSIVWGVLLITDRKACLVMTAVFLVLGCAFIVFAFAMYGRPFFEQVLHYQRVIRFVRGVQYLSKFAFVVVPAVMFALLNLTLSPSDWRARFPSLYTLFACLIAGYALFGEGINYNALFDVVIAMALTVGSLFNLLPGLLESGGVNPTFSSTLSALLLFAPVGANLYELTASAESVITRPRELPLARSVVDALADAKGPVACEIPAWCFWADKPIVYDVFSMAERAKRGGNEEARFVDQVANGYYAAIETQSNVQIMDQKNRPYWDALTRNYKLIISEPTEVWVPKIPDRRGPQATSRGD
jgi:hypothetical protein